jgi:hypothetical protein
MQLIITKADWTDFSNFLYLAVPKAVSFKVNTYLSTSSEPPQITKELHEKWDNSLNFADEMMYPSAKNIEQAIDTFNDLCDAICCLAFLPYGVEIFGHRYEVK